MLGTSGRKLLLLNCFRKTCVLLFLFFFFVGNWFVLRSKGHIPSLGLSFRVITSVLSCLPPHLFCTFLCLLMKLWLIYLGCQQHFFLKVLSLFLNSFQWVIHGSFLRFCFWCMQRLDFPYFLKGCVMVWDFSWWVKGILENKSALRVYLNFVLNCQSWKNSPPRTIAHTFPKPTILHSHQLDAVIGQLCIGEQGIVLIFLALFHLFFNYWWHCSGVYTNATLYMSRRSDWLRICTIIS